MDPAINAKLDDVVKEFYDVAVPFEDGVQLTDFMTAIAEGIQATEAYNQLMDMLAPGQTEKVWLHLLSRIFPMILTDVVVLRPKVQPT